MPQKNHLKTPTEDTLRGTGKLGWGEHSALHGTMKRLVSTFGDDVGRTTQRKKKNVTCPGCGQKFRSNSGNVPNHKRRFSHTEECNKRKDWRTPATPIGKAQSVIINEYEVVKGDIVAFTTYPWTVAFTSPHELKEYIIEDLILMDDKKIYLKLKDIDDEIPASMFARNFIKL